MYKGARFQPSPYCDERPTHEISLLVIHAISLPPGQFGGPYIEQLFCGQLKPEAHQYFEQIAGLRVSAHLLIDRRGRCVQYVPFNQRAWHAGASEYKGRTQCNDFSIGIELEGDDQTYFTAEQYDELLRVTQHLLCTYTDLSAQRIVGHSDIAPGRKTDPGPMFDWSRYLGALK